MRYLKINRHSSSLTSFKESQTIILDFRQSCLSAFNLFITSVVYALAINRRPVHDNFPIELMQQTGANLLLACKLICLAFNSADLSRSPLMWCMCYLSFRAVVHVKFSVCSCCFCCVGRLFLLFSFSLSLFSRDHSI